jgi:DNA polymerase-1
LFSPVNKPVTEPRPRLFLIDGSSYIFRAFYAIPPLNNSAGLPTNAIFGFTNVLLKFLKQYKPEYAAVALDAGRATFRNQIFTGYKGNRPQPPADLMLQFPYFRRVLEGLNVALLELPGYEADDIIATLCKTMSDKHCDLVAVSSDKDLMQLVTDGIKLLDSGKDRWIGAAEVHNKFGVAPEKVTQVMALMGDAVDNIPGVRGIGEKTAIALIQQFDNLENLFNRLDEVKTLTLRGAARVRKILEDGKHSAFLSRDLATVKRDVPLTIGLDELKFTGFNQEKLRNLFTELEFTNLILLLDNGRL